MSGIIRKYSVGSIFLLLLFFIHGCVKSDITCLSCQGVIVRYIYTAPTDTIILDYPMQYSPPLVPDSTDLYVMEGYHRRVDTIPNTMIHYTACYASDQYPLVYNANPYFFDHYCVKQ